MRTKSFNKRENTTYITVDFTIENINPTQKLVGDKVVKDFSINVKELNNIVKTFNTSAVLLGLVNNKSRARYRFDKELDN